MDAAEIDDEAARQRPIEWSDAQRCALLNALDELLADPTFKHSRRCSALLRGLVERVLTGNLRGFKERTLGVEIFGRDPGYDSNADPVVRMTATEIRKRLAQFYQQLDHEPAVRIRLVPGSYLPEIDFLRIAGPVEAVLNRSPEKQPEPVLERGADTGGATVAARPPVGVSAPHHAEPSATDGPRKAAPLGRRKWTLSLLGLAVVAGLAVTWYVLSSLRSTQYLVWEPLIRSGTIPVICLSDDGRLQQAVAEASTQSIADIIASRQAPTEVSTNTSVFDDVNAAHKVSLWLAEHGTATAVRPSSALSLWDFHKTPAILIGYTDNPWSLILLSQLRFSVVADPATHAVWIRDQQNPAKREWLQEQAEDGGTRYDYAVISRFINSDTNNWLVAIAGLGPSGTAAAAQLLTDPALIKRLPAGIRADRNFEMVIKANIVAGKVSFAQVMAFHTW